ncbi:MAG: helix-turn-helix transcriptional regulator [Bacteroidetes bacterium]|nr:helix-turn-helix transcriptional regulator [Bacteroidota bacterium]
MDLGFTIKNLRKQRKQTQQEFAERCGITQTYLSQIENNLKEPNMSTLDEISKELSLPLPLLFFLSMTESDIPEPKRQDFMKMAPALKSFVDGLFAV